MLLIAILVVVKINKIYKMAFKVLIVEDEEGIQSFLQMGLQDEGFSVSICPDLSTAKEQLQSANFDIMLLDWMLPDGEGIELIEMLRSKQIELPIIMLTAKDTVNDIVTGLKKGANDYLKKPFNFEELLQRIHVQLRDKQYPKVLENGPLKVLYEEREVFIGNQSIDLTVLEFELICALMLQTGKVCSRDQLISKVWQTDKAYKSASLLDVYISALRKKISLQGKNGQHFIQNVRGIGYKMEQL